MTSVTSSLRRQASELEERAGSSDEDNRLWWGRGINESVMGTIMNLRLLDDRDVKGVITSKHASTGMGKTTCGVFLSNLIDQNPPWTARERAYVADFWGYKRDYTRHPRHSVVFLDELEAIVDRRTPMSVVNREFRQVMAKYRAEGLITLSTVPTTDMIDRDVMKFLDFWIHIVKKGVALVNYLAPNDYTGKIDKYKLTDPRTGGLEFMFFPEPDPLDSYVSRDMAYLDMKKHMHLRSQDADYIPAKEVEKRVKKRTQEERDSLIRLWTQHTELTQSEIASAITEAEEVEWEMNQSRISQIVNA